MTFFEVRIIDGYEYIVPTQEEINANQHLTCYVGDEQTAKDKLEANKQAFLELRKDSFSINKEVIVGDTAVWATVIDIETDTHTGNYQVFSPLSGQYTLAKDKTEAVNLYNQYKQDWLNQAGFEYFAIDALPPYVDPSIIPVIPVEIM